ncbi:extensin family protein [Rhodobacteraceae bacterium D3-12]|nr:extensin family protein [Rhodobacteraceae bacterium D3-12]
MGKTVCLAGLIAVLWGTSVVAQAPDASLRPVARGQGAVGVSTPVAAEVVTPVETQGAGAQIKTEDGRAVVVTTETTKKRKGLFQSLRPKPRTERVSVFAGKKKRALRKGMVCGDLALQGSVVGRVPGRLGGCGVKSAIKLRSVSGVALSQQSVMDCGTAKALKRWVDKGLKPSIGRKGGGVTKIRVAAHYACRYRNNKRGGKISEHGKGRAIDISAFYLKDGSEVSVLKHWRGGWKGKALRQMHRAACGPFGTVLGPNANRYHRDHFHFDTARYRSGSYCK